MNIIVVSDKRGMPRKFDLKRPIDLLGLIALFTPPALCLVFAGYFFAERGADTVASVDRHLLRSHLETQTREIEEAKRRTGEDLEALGRRLGELRAHVIRLDALGRRLVQMGGLDDGEFDFSHSPAQGGPEPIDGSVAIEGGQFNHALDELQHQLADRERQLTVLEDVMLTRKLQDQVRPEGSPVSSGWVSSYFGRRTDPFTGRIAHHRGVDFAGKHGAPINAVAAGVVIYSGDRYGYGLLVEIDHGGGLATRYGHNSENLVSVGDTVERGEVIARMGATGRATGPNLHFEVHRNGRPANPLDFVNTGD